MTNTAAKQDTLMDLLLDAPEEQVETVQKAIQQVAVGQWKAAARTMSLAADWYDQGHAWADRAERVSAILRAKAGHS